MTSYVLLLESILIKDRYITGGDELHVDHELMDQVKEGDKKAYEKLVCKYRRTGILFARQILQDEYLAEDVVQDCFARIYILRDRYKNTGSFKSYLFTMIRNRSIDYIRKHKHVSSQADVDIFNSIREKSAEDIYIEKEKMQGVHDQLNLMRDDYRQILYLYAVEELSYKEIARVMKQTKAQVKIKLYRARNILKLYREKEG